LQVFLFYSKSLSNHTQAVVDGYGFGFPVTVFADKANTASRARKNLAFTTTSYFT
jgi:hypothetical protein